MKSIIIKRLKGSSEYISYNEDNGQYYWDKDIINAILFTSSEDLSVVFDAIYVKDGNLEGIYILDEDLIPKAVNVKHEYSYRIGEEFEVK
jgi:hypothetical protein